MSDHHEVNPYNLMGNIRIILQEIASLEDSADIRQVVIFMDDDIGIIEYSARFRRLEDGMGLDTGWHIGADRRLSFVRRIYNPANYNEIIGIIQLYINTQPLLEILQNTQITPDSRVYLLNNEQHVILSVPETGYGEVIDAAYILESIYSGILYTQKLSLDGRDMWVTSHRINRPHWYSPSWILVSITPFDDIRRPVDQVLNGILIMAVISAFTFFGFSCLFSFSIINRINVLKHKMRIVQQGNLTARVVPKGSDEIKDLMTDFNNMTERTESLLDEVRENLIKTRKMEFLALQAQINPHFLYNTLDMVNWAAIQHDAPEISKAVQALARFYKLSLNKGKDMISLADELAHLTVYMEIQNLRFDNAFFFETNISQEALDSVMLKTILQPLVENSIQHGILEKDERIGVIRVSADIIDDELIITVFDDGVGIEQSRIDMILQPDSDNDAYGIFNVRQRIQLYYGTEYGLTVESEYGHFTKVTVHLPAKHE